MSTDTRAVHSIDFSAAACKQVRGRRLESKYCEICGTRFLRPQAESAKRGLKHCFKCRRPISLVN